MQQIIFNCQTITPMFLAGADGTTPELRPPSIKGALRFWWRATNGHLRLEDTKKDKNTLIKTGLHTQETAIFGGAGGESGGQRSSFSIQVKIIHKVLGKFLLVPHKEGMMREAFAPGTTFEVILGFPNNYSVKIKEDNKDIEIFNPKKLMALFQLTCLLGGLGKRVRRGMGSVMIRDIKENNQSIQNVESVISLSNVYDLIKVVTPNYELKQDRIVFTGTAGAAYGWIRYIQIGRPNNDLLQKVSSTTNQLHREKGYEESLGHVTKGRFASPVYVSAVNDGNIAIITTLNTIPDRNTNLISLGLQEEFRNRIL